MKKMILTVAMAVSSVALFAQAAAPAASPLMDKKGEMYLPEAGDWAVAFDAGPLLTYAGNFFGKQNSNTAPSLNFIGNNYTIVGKYYMDDQTAIRGVLRIGFNSNSMSALTVQDQYTPGNPPVPMVTDKLSFSNHFIGLGAGMEKRKGKTRLQGYYGAELMFWISSGGNDSTMTYGNAYGTGTAPGTASAPHYHNFGNGTTETYAVSPIGVPSGRITADDAGSVFGLSIQAFVGVEYFVAPKISIGAEYTWGINFYSVGQGTLTTEQIYTPNGGGAAVDASVSYKSGSSSHFGVDTGVNPTFGNSTAGSVLSAGATDINIIFHF